MSNVVSAREYHLEKSREDSNILSFCGYSKSWAYEQLSVNFEPYHCVAFGITPGRTNTMELFDSISPLLATNLSFLHMHTVWPDFKSEKL